MGETVTFPNEVDLILPVNVYSNIEKISNTLSKGRVRIFYKGLNRNRTFISEDFANQLISSLPYVPIKGIFNYSDVDYEDHGQDNTDGRIYGIVPENPNFAWEIHKDDDGVEREYACCDVILYTALYPETTLIYGKPQSMEIYRDTLEGEWKIWEDGKPYFHFSKGNLLGLQILGSKVEPCFEGAAFFNLFKEFTEYLKYNKNKEKEENSRMDKSIFKLSDRDKADAIFNALNPSENIDYILLEVYDEYAVCRDLVNNKYVRISYSKDDNANQVSIGEPVEVFIVDVTQSEYQALETMKAMNGSYEQTNTEYEKLQFKIDELNKNVETYQAEKEELTLKNREMTESIQSYTQTVTELETSIKEANEKIDNYSSEKAEFEKQISELNNTITSLTEYKEKIENERKQKLIDEFSENLSDEQIKEYQDTMSNYSFEDFEKELCVTAYKANTQLFSKENHLIFKGNQSLPVETGMIKLLNRHINGGNK